jgi:hypothetical protein
VPAILTRHAALILAIAAVALTVLVVAALALAGHPATAAHVGATTWNARPQMVSWG